MDIGIIQWSSVMETNTCPVCASLDGRTITANEKATTPHNPQKHINCRCIWVRIPSSSGDYKEAAALDRVDSGKSRRIENAQIQTKEALGLPSGVSKKAAIESAKLRRRDPLYMTPAKNTSIDDVVRDARQHLATKRRGGGTNGDLVDSLVVFKGDKFIKIK